MHGAGQGCFSVSSCPQPNLAGISGMGQMCPSVPHCPCACSGKSTRQLALYHNCCSSCSSFLLCIQQKCSEACNPASLPPTPVSFLLVPKACWARGWGIWGQPLFFIFKVANLITNFPCQSPWLQDWLPATFAGRNGCQNHLFLEMGWGLGQHLFREQENFFLRLCGSPETHLNLDYPF